MAGIVGSPVLELEKTYRKLLLKIVTELRLEECEQIAFLAKLPAPTCHQEAGRQYDNVRLHFMSTLESLGHIGPLKLDYLEDYLNEIGKQNLVELITKYKNAPIYSDAKQQEKLIRRKERKWSKRSTTEKPQGSREAMLLSEYQSTYAMFLTQMSQMTLLLRTSLETHELQKVRETFLKAGSDGEAVIQALRQGSDTSSSSGDDTTDSAVSTPTDEERNLPIPPARMESLKVRNSAHSTPDSSPSPPVRKRPVPVPRKKLPQSKSVHCQASSPLRSPTNTGLYQQETEGGSTSAVVHLPPHSGKSLGYSGDDYSGSANDSGYGSGSGPKHVPPQELLEQLNPDAKTVVDHDEYATREGLSTKGYMKLIGRQEPTAGRYAKAHQTRINGVDDMMSRLNRMREELKD